MVTGASGKTPALAACLVAEGQGGGPVNVTTLLPLTVVTPVWGKVSSLNRVTRRCAQVGDSDEYRLFLSSWRYMFVVTLLYSNGFYAVTEVHCVICAYNEFHVIRRLTKQY